MNDTFKVLSQKQVNSFWENGFLRIGKIIEEDELELLRNEYDREFELATADRSSGIRITHIGDVRRQRLSAAG